MFGAGPANGHVQRDAGKASTFETVNAECIWSLIFSSIGMLYCHVVVDIVRGKKGLPDETQ